MALPCPFTGQVLHTVGWVGAPGGSTGSGKVHVYTAGQWKVIRWGLDQ